MSDLSRVLVVDGDAPLRRSLVEQLELNAEFAGVECGSAAAALEMTRREQFDAVLLGVDLPDMDGRELCRRLRDAGITVPIVMLESAEAEPSATLADRKSVV